MTPFLFVYGTLMRGFPSLKDWRTKAGAKYVGRARIAGKLYDLGQYPGLLPAGNHTRQYVAGELYEMSVPERALALLDRYEEFLPENPKESLFVRKIVPVRLESGEVRRAWVYFYNRPVTDSQRIPNGRYTVSKK
jgi:gamma-glutamylcyclotransferase (GGCT)/AIG2-like uncharacterized protein YtfP